MRLRLSLPFKLILSYLLVAGLITLPAFWFLRGSLTESLEAAEGRELRARAEALRGHLAPLEGAGLDESTRSLAMLLGVRVTVVDRSGRVLVDSSVAREAVGAMENHATRPEIVSAFATGIGIDVRRSESLKEELVYVAIPLEAESPVRALRLSAPRSKIQLVVKEAFVALRVGIGVGISAALLLSLVAAFYVSAPLRRMRDVAKAYAQGLWPEVKRLKTGDELEDLNLALIELGRQLRKQLVTAGAPEALLVQALDVLAVGAVFGPSGELLHLGPSFRTRLGWTAQIEPEALAQIKRRLLEGSVQVRTGPRSRSPGDGPRTRTIMIQVSGTAATVEASPLAQANGAPYWLLTSSPPPPTKTRDAALLGLRNLEANLRKRGTRGEVLRDLDAVGLSLSGQDDVARSVATVSARSLAEQCVQDLNEEAGAKRIVLSGECPEDAVVDVEASAARCLRMVVRAALAARGEGKVLDLSVCSDEATTNYVLDLSFDALEDAREELQPALRAAGANLTRAPDRGLWLTLPRA